MEQEIEQRVINVIAATFWIKPQIIQLSDSLSDDLGADSLDFVEIIISIEEEFGIEILDNPFEQLITVGDICNHVEEVLS